MPLVAGVVAAAVLLGCHNAPPAFSHREVELDSPTPVPGEFGAVAGFLELTPTTIVISDAVDRQVRLIDLSTRTVEIVGRPGGGPTEHRTPGALFRVGDSLWLHDRLNRRFAVLDASLSNVGTVPLTSEALWSVTPLGVDRHGRVLFEETHAPPMTGPDSVSVMRWTPQQNETVALFRVDATDLVTRSVTRDGRAERSTFAFSSRHPLSHSDEWRILEDSTIVVVRARPLHVEVRDLDGNVLRRTARIAHAPVPVTARDRDALEGTVGAAAPGAWKPPIVDGSAFASPDGHLWVQLHQPDTATFNAHLIVRSTGDVVGIVRTPKDARLVGLGQGAAYLATEDDVGLFHLTRYRVSYPSDA